MPKRFSKCIGPHRQPEKDDLNPHGAHPQKHDMPRHIPAGDRVDVKEPRYAMAALETIYRQTHADILKIPPEKLWFFAKFPEVWATEAIRRRPSHWNYRRCEPVVNRVRQLYGWAHPIIEG